MRFAKSLCAGIASVAVWAAACAGGTSDSNGSATAAASNNAAATSGGSGQVVAARPGEDQGRCLNGGQGGDCYAPNATNGRTGSACMCAEDPNAGSAGRACRRDYTCGAGLTCSGNICLPGGGTGGTSSGAIDECANRTGEEGCQCGMNRSCNGSRLVGVDILGRCTCINNPGGGTGGTSGGTGSTSGGTGSTSGGMGSTGGSGGRPERDVFEQDAKPKLIAHTNGSCTGCHANGTGPQFLAGADMRQAILNHRGTAVPQGFMAYDADSNPLANYHAGQGIAFNEVDKVKIRAWITAYRAENMMGGTTGGSTGSPPSSGGNPGAGPILSANDAMTYLGRCMTRTQFNLAINGNAAAQWRVANSGGGRCNTCHAGSGLAPAALASADETLTLARIPGSIYKYAIPALQADGRSYQAVVSYRIRDKGDEPGTHPKYLLDDDIMNAIKLFVEDANRRMLANTDNCRASLPTP